MSIFGFIKQYWDWADENPTKSNPSTAGVYFYFLRVANELNWKGEFSISSTQVMGVLSINYNTYKKYFDVLVESGLIKIVRQSKNQFSANIIALSNFNKARNKARDKAITKHVTKQDESSHDIHKTIKTNKTVKTNKADLQKRYSENEAVNSAFIEFLKHRIEIKKPATQRAADMLLSELKKLASTPNEAVEIINHSMMNGWQGFYKPKANNKPSQQQQFNRSSVQHYV